MQARCFNISKHIFTQFPENVTINEFQKTLRGYFEEERESEITKLPTPLIVSFLDTHNLIIF